MNRFFTSYGYELKKLLIVRKGWVILVCTLLAELCIACLAKPNEPIFDKELYADYVSRYGGNCAEETGQEIADEIAFETSIAEDDSIGELTTAQELEKHYERIMLANIRLAALNELQAKYDTLLSCMEYDPVLTYDLELTEYSQKLGFNIPSLICTMLLIPMLMLGDAECGMEQILFPTAAGRKTIVHSKILAAVTVGVCVTAICTVMQWCIISARWDMGALNVPIQSISGFENCTLEFSVMTCILISGAMRLLASFIFSLLLCALSDVLRKETAVISTVVIILVTGVFLSGKFVTLSPLFLSSAMSGIGTVRTFSALQLIILLLVLPIKAVILSTIIRDTSICRR